jgi:hypothetical protein
MSAYVAHIGRYSASKCEKTMKRSHKNDTNFRKNQETKQPKKYSENCDLYANTDTIISYTTLSTIVRKENAEKPKLRSTTIGNQERRTRLLTSA